MSAIIPASFNTIGGAFRFAGNGGTQEFAVVGFIVSDNGEIEKTITFPKVPKGAKVEHHDGVAGWRSFDLGGV